MRAIEAHPGLTRDELLRVTGLPGSRFDPERLRLWTGGEIEPDSEEGWTDALARQFKAVRWRRVDPSSRQDVAFRAAGRTPRKSYGTAEERARRIVEQLSDPTINRLVLEMTKDSGMSRSAQRRAQEALRRRHLEVRDAAARAKRDHRADADFLGLLRQLWDARGAVNAVHVHLIEERARFANDEPRQISDAQWMAALADVRTIIETMGEMWQNVRDLGDPNEPCPACGAPQTDERHRLGAFAIDLDEHDVAEVVDGEIAQN